MTAGVFAQVRNRSSPGMIAALWGLWALAPAWPGLVAAVAMIVAVELQVRRVEEPYLLATHGAAYRADAATVGRLVPGVGRLRPHPGTSGAAA
ncbi:methyltransferase [Pseudonocardia sp. NPDC049154]|uniref:methyltransferase n=1 Tax=Pseudonocardia sp. NPDC049154 TaxID=3155501 RepID=UPI0033E736DC